MNKMPLTLWPALVCLYLWALLLLGSWLWSLYALMEPAVEGAPAVQSLLSAEALRWWLRHAALNFAEAPLGDTLLLLAGAGVVERSGLFATLRCWMRGLTPTLAQRRALRLALVALLLCAALLTVALLPWCGLLLGVTGAAWPGPLSAGWPLLFCAVALLVGWLYGSAAGTLRGRGSLLSALVYYPALFAAHWLALFAAAQVVAGLRFSQLDGLLFGSEGAFRGFAMLLYWLPLAFLLMVHWLRRGARRANS